MSPFAFPSNSNHAFPFKISCQVTVGKIKAKYNPDQNVVLSATIATIKYTAQATWGCANLDPAIFAASALTPYSSVAAANAATTLQLAIAANVLSAGATYQVQLTTAYIIGSDVSSYASQASVSIVMNSPPVGGFIR